MIKRLLMIFLVFAFIAGVVAILFLFGKKATETSVSLPFLKGTPTPEVAPSGPTPVNTSQLLEIDSDLTMIETDLSKMKKEDKRLIPPTFIFVLGLK